MRSNSHGPSQALPAPRARVSSSRVRLLRVSTVAVAQSNLTVTITENPKVSQPSPLSLGTTTTTPSTTIDLKQKNSDLALVPEAVTLQQLVDGLNALGIVPRDLIAILQAIKATGALQAEIQVM